MKIFRNSPFKIIHVHVLLIASKCLMSSCEIPIPNNFGVSPEYGHVLSPDSQQENQNLPHNFHNSSNAIFHMKNAEQEPSSLETLSSMSTPQFDEGENYYNSREADYDYHEDDESSEELKNSKYTSNKGRGFENPSGSSLIQFLMSPLKPFSQRFRLPSLFRRNKKDNKRRRKNRPPTKGRGDRESRDDAISHEDEFDLHVDSDSSVGHRRKKKRGRGWRERGRGRKRRRKPIRGWRSRRRPRPKPHYDDDDDDDYEGDEYGDRRVPLKVTYATDTGLNYFRHHPMIDSGLSLSYDSHQYNNQPDQHKSKELSGVGEQLASHGNQGNIFRKEIGKEEFQAGNGGREPTQNFRDQHYPRSIYDKLPPSTTSIPLLRPYIAPADHPMRIMRPPIPPRHPPFASYTYQYAEDDGGNGVRNDGELRTPSASINSPKFPHPGMSEGRKPQNRIIYDENVPPPYLSPPLPFTSKFINFPKKWPRPPPYPRAFRQLGPGVSQDAAAFKDLQPTLPTSQAVFFGNTNTYWIRPPARPTLTVPEIDEDSDESEYFPKFSNPTASGLTSDSTQLNTPPQIIYGKWNPLVDSLDETIPND